MSMFREALLAAHKQTPVHAAIFLFTTQQAALFLTLVTPTYGHCVQVTSPHPVAGLRPRPHCWLFSTSSCCKTPIFWQEISWRQEQPLQQQQQQLGRSLTCSRCIKVFHAHLCCFCCSIQHCLLQHVCLHVPHSSTL